MTDENTKFECPICELQFPAGAQAKLKQVACPSCKHKFEAATAIITEVDRPVVPTAIPLPTTVPAAAAPAATPTPVASQPKPGGIQVNTGKNQVSYKRRAKKKPFLSSPLFLGLLLLMAASLIGVLAFVVNRDLPVADSTPEQIASNTDNPDGAETTPDDTPGMMGNGDEPAAGNPTPLPRNSADDEDLPTVQDDEIDKVPGPGFGDSPAEADAPDDEPKAEPFDVRLRNFGEKQIEKVWAAARPHLVNLKIENATGHTNAVGTIVDSRGWVLTSLSAIRGANQIEVTPAAADYDASMQPAALTDLVRGVLALSAEHDLVLLSVNRRFVISMANLEIEPADNLVGGYYLVQCEPPSHANPKGYSEGKVQRRMKFDQLDEPTRMLLERNQYSRDIEWIRYQGTDPRALAAPLLTDKGVLVGIKTGIQSDDTSFAVPSSMIAKLIKDVDEDAEAIPLTDITGGKEVFESNSELGNLDGGLTDKNELPMDLPGGLGDAKTKAPQPPPSLPGDHPQRSISVSLNKLGAEFTKFNWKINDVQRYELLNEFIQQIFNIEQTVNEELADDEAGLETMTKQLNYWRSLIVENYGHSAVTLEMGSAFNAIAMESVGKTTKERFFTAYATVHIGGIESGDIDGQPTCVMKVEGSEYYFRIIYDPDHNPMFPESRWLIATMLHQGSSKIKYDGKKLAVRGSDLYMLIGPMN